MDEKYIQKVLDGDAHSFRYFVNTYQRFAYSVALAIVKDEHLAEDVVQEAFIRVYKNLKSFKGQSTFKTWLCRIVINESLKKSKTRSRHIRPDEVIAEYPFEASNESFNLLVLEEQRKYINTTLKLLSPEESLALELFYLQEQSIGEIALVTEWSVSKTKMLLLRGRKNFYLKLEGLLKADSKTLL